MLSRCSGSVFTIEFPGTLAYKPVHIDLEDSLSAGGLGVLHLKRLWSRCLRERSGLASGSDHTCEWALDNVIYHGLNLPIEETVRFLYHTGPSFPEFERWIVEKNGVIDADTLGRINAAVTAWLSGGVTSQSDATMDRILSDDDVAFWEENGYLVISGGYSDDEVRAAEGAVWEHLGMDPDDPETWYGHPSDHGIMVQFFHHPALEVIRRSENLAKVFAQIWGTHELWTSTDRVSFNPPERPGFEFRGPRLHWDVSLELPIPFGVQGLVYLTDTPPGQGAFTCVPGFHTRIESWLKSLPPGTDPRDQKIEELGAMPIPGRAGDIVIWHQALPHGSSPNRETRPRIVEYVTMFPADAEYAKNWR